MDIRQWFLDERGLTEETLTWYGVVTDGGKAILPYLDGGEKTRIMMDDGSRKFFFTPGLTPGLFYSVAYDEGDVAFIVEGETDTMRLQQELQDRATVYGLSGIEGWQTSFARMFENYDRVYVILDNDQDYNVVGRVETAWQAIRADLGSKATRLRLPRGVKDVCDFFDVYDLTALELLAEQAPSQQFHYEPLDLTSEPPEVDWLVNDLIARGDVSLMIGEPSVGKSWLSMALACAVANGDRNWLGRSVLRQGRVLYVDEENPRILVQIRLNQLGLTEDGAKNIRYLHQQGVRLDRHPEWLLEEAQAYDPELIVIDSLTRVHTEDENNAGAMASLFNDGLNPLARITGATVLLLHHVNKSDASSAFGRVRGSSDIPASIDTGFDVRKSNMNRLNVILFKSRWKQAGEAIGVRIEDTPDGGVEIESTNSSVF